MSEYLGRPGVGPGDLAADLTADHGERLGVGREGCGTSGGCVELEPGVVADVLQRLAGWMFASRKRAASRSKPKRSVP